MQENTPFDNGVVGTSDAIWYPDFDTFRILPWYRKTASILIEPKLNGKYVSCYPRFIARQQLDCLQKLGISMLSAHEHEFYLVNRDTLRPLMQDRCLRSTVRTYTDPNILDQLMTNLYKAGLDIENGESEGGPGQMEITYKPAFGIQAADNAHFFKTAVKEIAQQHGYTASFMSKPFKDQMGSSAHFCHSLWDSDGKKNLLYNANTESELSEVGKHWMAGILKHSHAITMLMAPTVNCYNRLHHTGYVSRRPIWGTENRSCMLRVKLYGSKGACMENRCSGGGSNPYLTLAAVVAAGIDGIERKIPLPAEVKGDGFKLSNNECESIPSNLPDAMDAFKADDVIRQAFGEDFLSLFSSLKSYEINAKKSSKNVDDEDSYTWDRKMFFNYL